MKHFDFVHVAKPNQDGARHYIGITSSGAAFSWGKNNFGQLGRISTAASSTTTNSSKETRPVEFEANSDENLNDTRLRFVKAYVGGLSDSGHSALLDSRGHVWLAGCDRWQQLGLGSTSGGSSGYTWNQGRVWRNKFVRNDFLAKVAGPIRDVALGGDHTVVLSSNQKDVYVFGKGGEGQLGVDGKPFVSAPTRSKILSSSSSTSSNNDEAAISAVCAIQQCSLTLDENGQVITKTGKCRSISQSLGSCIRRAEADGLLSHQT